MHRLKSIALSALLFSALGLGIISAPANADNIVPGNTVPGTPTDLTSQNGNNCSNGEVIDNSTAEETLARFQAAGYTNVQILEKGCDNYWHATGVKNGQTGNIVLSPTGNVMPEGY